MLIESLEEFIPDIPDETENAPSVEQPLDHLLSVFFKRVFAYTAHKVLEVAQMLPRPADAFHQPEAERSRRVRAC